MRYLLDTHTLRWMRTGDPRLDRSLIAQAMELGATAITDDAQWQLYRLQTDW